MRAQIQVKNMPRAVNPKIPKKKVGHPKIPIDWNLVDELLKSQCSGPRIAAALGIHPDTLYDRCVLEKRVNFSEYAATKKETGKAYAMLRQYKSMMKGNASIMLHWATHHLEQPHRSEVKQQVTQEITQRTILKLPDNGNRFPEQKNESENNAT